MRADQEAGDHTAFAQLVKKRRSCRAFLPEPLPNDIISQILETAQKSPSWNNVQPWQLVVTRGAGTERFRRFLLELAHAKPAASRDFDFPREYTGDYLLRRRACGFGLYAALGIARGDKEAYARQSLRNFGAFDAPHIAIVTSDEALGIYGAVDCGGYVSHFMLAAQSLGVASIAQGALAEYGAAIRCYFGMSEPRRVVCGISFGLADASHPANKFATDRAGIEDVVSFHDE